MTGRVRGATLLFAATVVSLGPLLLCAGPTAAKYNPSVESPSKTRIVPLGLDRYMPVPRDNRLTREKVALGRKLFFDRLLSRNRRISCATCHDPRRAFTDGRPLSVGVSGRKGSRNVPTLINRGYGTSHFWDGRVTALEEQVLRPIQDPKELDMTLEELVERLKRKRYYRRQFRSTFAREPNPPDLARALASYVRTILSGDAPFDRYQDGKREALSEKARQGLRIFAGKGNCTLCHRGPNFTDEGFHNTGIAWRDGRLLDSGRYAVTGREKDGGAFKTPTLREIALTAPYMHDGSLATLEEVIEFYNRGGNPNLYLDPDLQPLRLTEDEKAALLAFLRSLSGTVYEGKLK